jgi:bacterioferritin-associated ferredoxin
MLAADLMARLLDVNFHGEGDKDQDTENLACMLNYCNELEDLKMCFEAGTLCGRCTTHLHNAVRRGGISLDRAASILRIFNLAVGCNHCFIAMPFRESMAPVYDAVSAVFAKPKWKVVRADKIPYPKRITTAILLEILVSDLVIADLTGGNPNVFYEVGVTHSVGQNLLPIIQKRHRIPFDLHDEAAIRYTDSDDGLRKLQDDIREIMRNY